MCSAQFGWRLGTSTLLPAKKRSAYLWKIGMPSPISANLGSIGQLVATRVKSKRASRQAQKANSSSRYPQGPARVTTSACVSSALRVSLFTNHLFVSEKKIAGRYPYLPPAHPDGPRKGTKLSFRARALAPCSIVRKETSTRLTRVILVP